METQGVKESRSFRGIQSTILTAVGNSVLLHPNIKLVPSLSSDGGNLSHSRIDIASTPSYSIVTAWWCLWLISGIIDGALLFQFLNLRENDIDAHIELNYAIIVLDFLTIVAGILVFVVVRRITENQETKWIKIAETKEIRIPPIPPKSFPTKLN